MYMGIVLLSNPVMVLVCCLSGPLACNRPTHRNGVDETTDHDAPVRWNGTLEDDSDDGNATNHPDRALSPKGASDEARQEAADDPSCNRGATGSGNPRRRESLGLARRLSPAILISEALHPNDGAPPVVVEAKVLRRLVHNIRTWMRRNRTHHSADLKMPGNELVTWFLSADNIFPNQQEQHTEQSM